MVAGAAFVMSRPTPATSAGTVINNSAHATSAPATDMASVLKHELFELETQRIEGKISPDEYEKAKAGLEVLIKSHLAKKG